MHTCSLHAGTGEAGQYGGLYHIWHSEEDIPSLLPSGVKLACWGVRLPFCLTWNNQTVSADGRQQVSRDEQAAVLTGLHGGQGAAHLDPVLLHMLER